MIQVDRNTVIQILGSLMCRPDILSDIDKYQLEPTDFTQHIDKLVFSAIYNLYVGGAEKIRTIDIDSYLSENENAKTVMETNGGLQFVQDCETLAEPTNFNYYYNRLKKFNLLRDLQKDGTDISKFYCEDPLNESYEKINARFEQMTATDIFNNIKGSMADLEHKYVINNVVEESKAADNVRELIKTLSVTPEIGAQLQGDMFNTVCRGARKGKLYLLSAGSGVGKTRTMVGNACKMAYPVRYDNKYNKWVYTGEPEKVLYVMTEQDPAEIQTMILAYLTGYNEDLFTYGSYTEEHMDRIMKAVDIMEKYQDYFMFARIPDPCASVVKNLFRRYNLQHGVENFFYDYIFSSPAMLNEYRDLKLREDVCLRLLTTAIKNLAVELNSFIMSGTQLSNDDDPKGGFKDFRNIRGSKAIVDLADFAAIRRRPSPEELQLVASFEKMYNYTPNAITDIYKNRRGRWNMISIWSVVDLGTLRTVDLFVTTPDYKPVQEFQIVNFVSIDMDKRKEIEDFYNDGILSDEMADDLLSRFAEAEEIPKSLSDSISEAFGEAKDHKERLRNMSFDELI